MKMKMTTRMMTRMTHMNQNGFRPTGACRTWQQTSSRECWTRNCPFSGENISFISMAIVVSMVRKYIGKYAGKNTSATSLSQSNICQKFLKLKSLMSNVRWLLNIFIHSSFKFVTIIKLFPWTYLLDPHISRYYLNLRGYFQQYFLSSPFILQRV